MIEALNRKLEIVRTVLQNDVNEISVCVDRKRNTGVFYTMIAVSDPAVRKQLALWVATDEGFTKNSDYLGSFSVKDTMYLLFAYHPERHLAEHLSLYTQNFARRKALAVALVAACAETGFTAQLGSALLHKRNLNVDQDGKVYFNYFIDFKPMLVQQPRYFQTLSQYVFHILSQEYQEKLHGDIMQYPHELQVYHRKMQNTSFTTFYQLLTTVQAMPDVLTMQRGGIWRLVAMAKNAWHFLKRNATTIFVVVLLTITLGYLSWQIYARVQQSNILKNSIRYGGLQYIGDVYLGEEML